MSLASLSEAEKRKTLSDFKQKQLQSRNAVSDFVDQGKASLLPQYNWEEFLAAAPLCINLIGSLYIASAIHHAPDTLHLDESSCFQHLSSTSLRSCLTQCGDHGMRAFRELCRKVTSVSYKSKDLSERVTTAVRCLQESPDVAQDLEMIFDEIKASVQDSVKQTKEVDQHLSKWCACVEELRHCCLADRNSDDTRDLNEHIQIIMKQVENASDDALDLANKSIIQHLTEDLNLVREIERKVVHGQPSGWDMVGQQLVGGLRQTVNNTLNSAIMALIQAQGPVSKQPDVLPSNFDASIYAAVGIIVDMTSILQIILTGSTDGGVDWEVACPTPGEGAHGAVYILDILEVARKHLNTGSNIRGEALDMLDKTIQVAKAFKIAAESGGKDVDTTSIDEWQKIVRQTVNEFTTLQAFADSISKSTPTQIDLKHTEAVDPAGSITAAILTKAVKRAAINHQKLLATQENYRKAVQVYSDVAESEVEIALELSGLGNHHVDIVDIIAILTKSTETALQLQTQVRKLTAGFSALLPVIEYITKVELPHYVGASDSDDGSPSYSMTRQIIFNAIILIRSYSMHFADIAQMWAEIDRRHVREGVNLIEHLIDVSQSEHPEDLVRMVAQFERWTGEVTGNIKRDAARKRADILRGMEKRTEEAAQCVQMLPTIEEDRSRAIEKGKDLVVKAALNGLDKHLPPVADRTFA